MIRGRYLKDMIGLLLLMYIQIPVHATNQSLPRVTRQQLRQMIKSVAQEKDPEVRKAKIRQIHEEYGKP